MHPTRLRPEPEAPSLRPNSPPASPEPARGDEASLDHVGRVLGEGVQFGQPRATDVGIAAMGAVLDLLLGKGRRKR